MFVLKLFMIHCTPLLNAPTDTRFKTFILLDFPDYCRDHLFDPFRSSCVLWNPHCSGRIYLAILGWDRSYDARGRKADKRFDLQGCQEKISVNQYWHWSWAYHLHWLRFFLSRIRD